MLESEREREREREREDDDVREIPAVGAPLHSTRSLH